MGGVAGSASVDSTLTAKFDGTINSMVCVLLQQKITKVMVQIVIGRTGEVRIIDEE